ncbi:kelch domain-containing protein [Colletotrichum nymphaeae SA-01]|uniref:Kelch domain-containing protein n=1 Tax=Colletotrichum nymphaeae SA-01 TaxID=1460502 RepID=A0A135TN77_9PEZI|nr:kelch domain-containing protein [Colletotrichum nymphaeae SA-01]
MESFGALKRRTTEILQSLPQNLPNMPNVKRPSLSSGTGPKPMKGTWERIDVPPLARSSHTVNVVNGSAYVFGGEVNPREPVDNDVHVIRLPYNSAGADYYKIKSAPAKQYTPPADSEPTTTQTEEKIGDEKPEASGDDVEEKAALKEQLLDEVSLASPSVAGEEGEEYSSLGAGEQTTSAPTAADKGKGPALPEPPVLGGVPGPRVGHATAVIGSRIFLYGGRGGPDMTPLEEAGRVWVFDTRTNSWSFLDPVPPAPGVTNLPMPSPRSYHSAAATDRPRDFAPKHARGKQTWRAWAQGDSADVGIPQAPIVGHAATNATDEEDDGYGTFFVHAGCLANGERTNDLWAFDVRSRVWSQLPSAPGPARGGAAITVSKSRLFRFGGYDGKGEIGGQLDFIHLEMDTFDDGVSKGEIAVHGRGGWQSIAQGAGATPSAGAGAGEQEIHLVPGQTWPGHRSVAGLEAVTVGAGREYLLLIMGEREPSADGHAGAGAMWDDVWAFQVPPLGMTAASVRDAMLQAIGRPTGEGKWTRLSMEPYDDDNDDGEPAPRGWFAAAAMGDVEEAGVVVWGGLSSENKRLRDGWILRIPE